MLARQADPASVGIFRIGLDRSLYSDSTVRLSLGMQPITLLGAAICFWVLYSKYRNAPKGQTKSTRRQKIKLAKMLVGALLALMAITYSMRGLGDRLDGKPHEPTIAERVITFLMK
jgi:hypothetical protein